MTAREVAAAIGHACWELGIDCVEVPMADGGDGILDALGGPNRTSVVTGPLGDPLTAAVAAGEGHGRDRDGAGQRAGARRRAPAELRARCHDDRARAN